MALNEVLDYSLALGGEYRFGVELYAVDVVVLMLESHDLSLVAHGSHLQTGGEVFSAHHPRVVSAHGDSLGQRVEDIVVRELCTFGSHTVEYVAEVFECAAKHLSDGLMTKANAKYWFASLVCLDDIEQ